MLKLLIPAAAILAAVWFVDIPKEWLPGKSERQVKAEQEKAEQEKADAARKAVDAVAVRRFDDPDGFFTIDFPGKPDRHGVSANQMFNMLAVAGFSHTKKHDGILFDARYERWEVLGKTAAEKLDKRKPKLLTGPGLPAPRVRAVTAATGAVGFEAAGVYEDRPRKFKMTRVFLVPEQKGTDRYYSATVTGPADWLPNEKAEAFLKSFELTDRTRAFPLPGAPGAVLD